MLCASFGDRLTFLEAKELSLLIAPTKSGQITKDDLRGFMDAGCRPLGSLLKLVERDLLKPLVDEYRKMQTKPDDTNSEVSKWI